jgi:hypothetical protein
MRRSPHPTPTAALLLTLCGAVAAQTAFNPSAPQAQNQRRLNRYHWNSREELRVGGDLWAVSSYACSYDSSGDLRQTQVGGGAANPDLGLRPFKRIERQFKQQRIDMLIADLQQQLQAYEQIAPDRARSAMSRAIKEPGAGSLAHTNRLTVSGVLNPKDKVTVWVDSYSGIQHRMEIESAADGQAFTAVWTFAQLPKGPWHLAKREVDIPAKKMQLVTVNSGYWRL